MPEVTAYLSPNGQNYTSGDGPATRLRVATVEGIATLERDAPDTDWHLTGRTLADRHIGSLLFEPRSGKLFAGAHADGGMWVSDDGAGEAWRQIMTGLDRPHVYSLAVRYVGDQTTLFLGTSPAALYRSEDLGESWTEMASLLDVPDTDKWTFPPPPHIPHVKWVVFHPEQPDTIYVCVEQGALLKSTDDGETWIELAGYSDPSDIAYRDLHRLLINPKNPDNFYLTTGEGLYRSDDGGEEWDHLIRRGDQIGYPDFVYLHPEDDNTVYVAGSVKSPGSWRKERAANSSIMRSTDRGETWQDLDEGLPKPVVGAFEAMCQHEWAGGMMLVIGTATGELYTSENNGDSWDRIIDPGAPVSKDDHHLPFMAVDPRRPGQPATAAE